MRSGLAIAALIIASSALVPRETSAQTTPTSPERPGPDAEPEPEPDPEAEAEPEAELGDDAAEVTAAAEPELRAATAATSEVLVTVAQAAAMRSAIDTVTVSVLTQDGNALEFVIGGYVETGFTWSFNEPSNGVIAWRGFDNRHATFALSNVALRMRMQYDRVYTSFTLQWGTTPDTYYLAEPSAPAVSGIGASSAATWRFLQQAYLGWDIPLLSGIRLEGGVFLSPIGFEGMSIRDDWTWSRSNLFYGLPFYHTGVRLVTTVEERWTFSLALFNGWNSVLDNNDEKSLAAWIDYASDELSFHALYFGGVERVDGNWRHLFDAWLMWRPTEWLSLALHGNAGFEPISGAPSNDATSWWAAGAVYARVMPLSWLAIAARADVFADHAPVDDPALRIFWPTPMMSSQTVTLQLIPDSHISFYVEYRHDWAAEQAIGGSLIRAFYAGDVGSRELSGPANATSQDTLTLGAAAGF
jgi:hypothetical protein